MSIKAYYSLVQFIPDPSRDERVNVGVILQSPEYGFAGMEVRRHIDRTIRCVFPNVDGQLVHYLVHGIARSFDIYDREPEYKLLDFDIINTEHPTHPGYVKRFNSPFSQVVVREPRPIFLQDNQGFKAKLTQLFSVLVQSQRPERSQPHITKGDLRRSVESELARRHVALIKDPPKFPGKRWPNSFDALKQKDNRRWIQYMSFDQQELPVDQAKSFIASVADMRDSKRYPDDEFGCVIQPPRGELKDTHRDTFDSALITLNREEIAVFLNEPDEISRLAFGLENQAGLRGLRA